MRSPKKVSGMGCWVTALLFLLFVGSVVTLMWPVAILILFVDAVIYYATLKKNCCPECKGKECVIPLNTPMGQKLMRDFKSAPPAVASFFAGCFAFSATYRISSLFAMAEALP